MTRFLVLTTLIEIQFEILQIENVLATRDIYLFTFVCFTLKMAAHVVTPFYVFFLQLLNVFWCHVGHDTRMCYVAVEDTLFTLKFEVALLH